MKGDRGEVNMQWVRQGSTVQGNRGETHQCVTGHNRAPELAAVDATKKEVLFGCLVLRIHHDNAPS